MAKVIIMPKQGQSVESCIITQWYKKKGDSVKPGDILFSYETDKASFEEEAKDEGFLLDIFFQAGEEVPVLTNVCVIGQKGESVHGFLPESKVPDIQPAVESPSNNQLKTSEEKLAHSPCIKISPRARKFAEVEQVELTNIKGSGPNGRILEKDVRAVFETQSKTAAKPSPSEIAKPDEKTVVTSTARLNEMAAGGMGYGNDYKLEPLTNMRKLIAKAMHTSLQNSAQLTHHLGADARRILSLRNKAKDAAAKGFPVNITLNDFICFAVIKALKKFPRVNSHFLGDNMKLFPKVHLGLAVDTDRGLMVPVVRNADDLSVSGLASQFKEIAGACRKGNITPELLAAEAASFTISNLGNYGVEMFTPVINLPQSAILGVNTIVPRPKDLGEGVYAFVPYLGLSLTYDHRALDGGEATRFLKQIAVEIENLEADF